MFGEISAQLPSLIIYMHQLFILTLFQKQIELQSECIMYQGAVRKSCQFPFTSKCMFSGFHGIWHFLESLPFSFSFEPSFSQAIPSFPGFCLPLPLLVTFLTIPNPFFPTLHPIPFHCPIFFFFFFFCLLCFTFFPNCMDQ